MRRREFLGGVGQALSLSPARAPLGADAFRSVGSKTRITGLKVFGVSLTPESDRPYVFVKLETDAGVIGWGEATLE
ncbi:MAG: galactonate dehydratase, partial [Acidobacteria bacterium]|nr:galactonate dehydratase [Acidobacteriota bacterium]